MNIFIFILINILLQTPIFGITFVNNEYIPADYVVRADKITAQVKDKLSTRYNMPVVGITGGMIDCVNVLGLSFEIRGPLTKDTLREMLVDSVEEFLGAINADEKLRPFLKNYPFTSKEIEITFFIKNKDGTRLYDPEISIASACWGKINFNKIDKNNPYGRYKWLEEDYETTRISILGKKKFENISRTQASDFLIKRLIPSPLCQKHLLRDQ